MSLIEKEKIFDLWFAAATKEQIRKSILALETQGKATSVIFANAHVVVESTWDKGFQKTLQDASLIVPDGVPIAWVLQNIGRGEAQRYSGPDLMTDIFKETSGKKHFFLGSTPETLEKMKIKLTGLNAQFYSPPFAASFSEEEKKKQMQMVSDFAADFIWVGLGAPKQEKHVLEMAGRAGARGVWLAVGAAFDFIAGNKPRAPHWMQNVGMEWAYRMASDPKRLAKRYLSTNPVFMKLALQEVIRRKIG